MLCNGGNTSITVTAAGGTPAYSYSLNGGAAQASNVFTNVTAGTYTITTTDINGCSVTAVVTVTEPTLLTATASAAPVLCNGGNTTITVTAAGGTPAYSYSLNGGAAQASNVFTNVTAGTYTITTTDINGCSVTAVVTVTEPTLTDSNSLCCSCALQRR